MPSLQQIHATRFHVERAAGEDNRYGGRAQHAIYPDRDQVARVSRRVQSSRRAAHRHTIRRRQASVRLLTAAQRKPLGAAAEVVCEPQPSVRAAVLAEHRPRSGSVTAARL